MVQSILRDSELESHNNTPSPIIAKPMLCHGGLKSEKNCNVVVGVEIWLQTQTD
jgi:hypothetical protein